MARKSEVFLIRVINIKRLGVDVSVTIEAGIEIKKNH